MINLTRQQLIYIAVATFGLIFSLVIGILIGHASKKQFIFESFNPNYQNLINVSKNLQLADEIINEIESENLDRLVKYKL
jgi:hypothetical protein